MCGIAGIFNFDGEPVSSLQLRRMTDAIAHRGPDSEGFYLDNFLGLGHRRLAIIDLSPDGQQPMVTRDKQYAITYNGEIYNFAELRVELERIGYCFKSKTDTEVVMYAYVQWGPECVSRFNGMFAFAIWDKSRRELFIARDRYGIKPVYYTFAGNSFVFASEQKAILTHPICSREVDKETLLEYFTFQNIFTDGTLLKGIKLFPPGHYGKISIGNSGISITKVKYWDFDFQEPAVAGSEQEYTEELDRLFQQAVRRQLVADVDLGSYLSGGMDSGSITVIAARELPYIKTFTCGFDLHSLSGIEVALDERENAEYMSYLFKTEHYEMVLKAGDMERILPRLAWHLEEPRVGQSYPNFYIAQLTSKFVKVVLAGTGGDELFGGYPWRYYRAMVNNDFEEYIDKYYQYWQRLIPNGQIKEVFKPLGNEVKHFRPRDIFKNVFCGNVDNLARPEDYINHSLYFEAKTFLHGLLVVEDKLSMAHGLETRVPFLDNDLVDFAMRLPVRFKLNNLASALRIDENEPGKYNTYFQKTNDGKLILRKVMERYIPKAIADAAKQGFDAPGASWFRGESIEYVRKMLCNKNANIYNYMDYQSVNEIMEEHFHGKQNRRLFIWSLLSFEWWCREFITA